MPKYCLDSNVYIQAKNGPYGMDFHTSFWNWLDMQTELGVIESSIMVYDELVDGDDDLAEWVKARKDSGLFIAPNEEVQRIYGEISDHVVSSYEEVYAKVFLEKADAWIIAQAKADEATVVTHEVMAPSNTKKVKIPNVCNQFSVETVNVFTMLRHLRVQF